MFTNGKPRMGFRLVQKSVTDLEQPSTIASAPLCMIYFT